jgi:hypothetical protein
MTQARAWQHNYQVNSFLTVHTNSSMNGVLLNHCDHFPVLRNIGQDPIGSCSDPTKRMEQLNKWKSYH